MEAAFLNLSRVATAANNYGVGILDRLLVDRPSFTAIQPREQIEGGVATILMAAGNSKLGFKVKTELARVDLCCNTGTHLGT